MEIRKREAKTFLISKQIEDIDEILQGDGKENEEEANRQELEDERLSLQKQIETQQAQVTILNQSTEENLEKRHSMKAKLFKNYQ